MLQAYPQNYLYLGISSPLILSLFVITLIKLMKNSTQRNLFVKLFLLAVFIVILYNYIIKRVAHNKLWVWQTSGWVLACLPLLTVVYMAYYYVTHDKCLNSVHSVFSECLPLKQQHMYGNIVRRLS